MSTHTRPDPDALLAKVRHEEGARSRGRLRIFFGAVAGVGKTYAMLEAARDRKREGIDVVVGLVETHGRPETARLVEGLPALPRRAVTYRGRDLEEFDLDEALRRRPGLLLVDELAHTNVPGSRHERRHQDIDELLRSGIDVYTTLNVQHLESLNDLVAQVTGIAVRETVPDSVLETADEVELIDLPPDELLMRLREGKVYLPEQADRALAGFFRKANLIALRELALRATADRVDAQMQVYRRAEAGERTWPITEKILVSVSPSPSAIRVVRAGRRLARRLRAGWTVVYIEEPRHARLSRADREYADQALRAAEQLGGETVTLAGHDAVEELLRYARDRNFSKIVVGKPGRFWRLRDLVGGSFVARLAARSGTIDVFIVHGGRERGDRDAAAVPSPRRLDPRPYLWGAGTVLLCTILTRLMFPHVALANLIMVYLVGVVLVANRWGRGASILAAILSVGAFDFMYVTPYFNFAVSDSEYLITFVVMLLVALLISTLTVRVREQAEMARLRERRTNALYALSRTLASTRNLDAMIDAVRRQTREIAGADAAVYLAGEDGRLTLRGEDAPAFAQDAKETAVAQWVHEHSEPAGRGTATLAGAGALHLPLVGSRGPVGVVAIAIDPERIATGTESMHLFETVASQAALALERALLARDAHRQRLAAEGEKLRNAILAAVSHDLRTPLAAIAGAASSLAGSDDRLAPGARRELVLTIHEEAQRMSRLANNLLEMGRLQAKTVALKREWQPIEEVFGSALNQVESSLAGREVVVRVPDDLPQVAIDEVLIERVLVNLLENALRYTPSTTAIELTAGAAADAVVVEVLDRGPGLVPGEEAMVFDKFFRGEAGSARQGAGLGLAVARAIVEAHGGRIEARNRDGGGAVFRFILPLGGGPPPLALETEGLGETTASGGAGGGVEAAADGKTR
ncbi:MAG TPA: sensor histidine kinase KdpD [Candidatus Polarisedimenticolia bacterium]|nr:sensor histidine kinase KdpD [Candidatus Polarisedimenticolia bacterium]